MVRYFIVVRFVYIFCDVLFFNKFIGRESKGFRMMLASLKYLSQMQSIMGHLIWVCNVCLFYKKQAKLIRVEPYYQHNLRK